MKKISFLLVLIIQVSCTKNMQENEVKATIEGESLSFHTDSDRSKYLEYWGDSKDMKLTYSGLDRTLNFITVNDLKIKTKNGTVRAATMAKSKYSNYAIRVSGTVAWAMFDQKAVTPEGRETDTHEFRCLEKINGKWKIIGSSIHRYNQ
jgi:hypothetical protein